MDPSTTALFWIVVAVVILWAFFSCCKVTCSGCSKGTEGFFYPGAMNYDGSGDMTAISLPPYNTAAPFNKYQPLPYGSNPIGSGNDQYFYDTYFNARAPSSCSGAPTYF